MNFKRLICFFLGHKKQRINYRTRSYINLKRKSSRKRGRGICRYSHSHHYTVCLRCGKIISSR